jgi:hypothetical protein
MYDGRVFSGLTHYEGGTGSKLIGRADYGGTQGVAKKVCLTALIDEAGNA